MKIVGYTDALSVEPNDRLHLMVSAESPTISLNLVRLIHGDPHPDGPGYRETPVCSSLDGTYPAKYQPLVTGSYIEVPHDEQLNVNHGLTIHLFVLPTLFGQRERGLISKGNTELSSWSLVLDERGRVRFAIVTEDGSVQSISTQRSLRLGAWHSIAARANPLAQVFSIDVAPVSTGPGRNMDSQRTSGCLDLDKGIPKSPSDLLIGARSTGSIDGKNIVQTFDGKIGNPSIFGRALGDDEIANLHGRTPATSIPDVVSAWDFGREISSRRVLDASDSGLHGHTINMPTRGVPGPWWKRDETHYRDAPEEYAAIHFHEDDLDDAGWDPTVEWMIPADLPSGIYGIRIQDDHGSEDCVPFFVRRPNGLPASKALFLAPVFSYLAYANEHTLESDQAQQFLQYFGGSANYPIQPNDEYIVQNQLHSLYDRHHDGSGVCYSSWLRPILNMRPKYHAPSLNLGKGAAHQLNADLHITDWLHEKEIDYDVATDVDVHRDGAKLLAGYQVVITGTHPEYFTRPMLDAIRAYTDNGGRLMYLGGNGFYWVTGFDAEEQHTVEVRRCGASTRAWEMEPGAWHLTTTGELGGLWRMRDLNPQSLVGTGFTAQGLGGGRPYRRQSDSFDARAKFIFANIGENELIGDFPNLVNIYGAAGFELDRADYTLGTPPHALILATANEFTDAFQHAIEDVLMSDSSQGGCISPLVRSDMVFFECPGGGAVFSVGSIAWSGCLAFNNYDNNVSSITENVLNRFLSSEPFELPGN